MTQPLRIDQVADAFVSVPGFVSKILDTASGGDSTTSAAFVAASGASGTFVVPVAGQYYFLAMLNFYHLHGSDNRVQARFRLNFDSGATILGEDSPEYDIDMIHSGWRTRRLMMFGPAELSAGAHPFTVDWKRSAQDAGTPSINYDLNEPWTIYAIAATGSGAGGALAGSKSLLAEFASAADHSVWQDVDNGGGDALSVTFDAAEGDNVLVSMLASARLETGVAGTVWTRFVLDGTPIAQTQKAARMDAPTGVSGNASSSFVLENLAAGQHTVKVQARKHNNEQFKLDRTAGVGNLDRGQATLQYMIFRGGLVPIERDGVQVLSTPRAIDFRGASLSVSDDGTGRAVVQLADAVTAPGDLEVLADDTQTSTTVNSGTWTKFAPSTSGFTFVPKVTGRYRVDLHIQWSSTNVAGTGLSNFDFRVKLDDGSTPVYVTGGGAGPHGLWSMRTAENTFQTPYQQTAFVASVELVAGTAYTVTAEASRRDGADEIQVDAGSAASHITLQAIAGSGAGGVVKTSAELQADFSHTGGNAWLDVDNGGGDSLLASFETAENEDVLFILRMELQHTSGSAFEGAARLDIDSGTIFGGMGDDATTAAGGNTKLTIDRTWVRRFAAGQHTAQVQAFSSAAILAKVNATLDVIQFRGGLVPIQADGVQKLDKPAALNFIGAEVVDVGGVADVSLPAAVTTSGSLVRVRSDQPATAKILLGGSYTQFMPDTTGEEAFTIPAAGRYRVTFSGVVWGDAGAGTGQVELRIDEGGANPVNVGGDADDSWRIRAHNGHLSTFTLTTEVELTAGAHTLKAYGKIIQGSGLTFFGTATAEGVDLVADFTLVSGSGAGGVVDAAAQIAGYSAFTNASPDTWEPVTGLSKVVDCQVGEWLLLIFNGDLSRTVDHETYLRFTVDGSDIGLHQAGGDIGGSGGSASRVWGFNMVKPFKATAKQHTIGVDMYSATSAGATLRDYSTEFGIQVIQFRGGLVPIRADGVTKIDKPAAQNFIGAEVVNSGGVADISLPAAVTAPATPHVLTDGQPTGGDIAIAASPTYTQIAPQAGSFSIEVAAETTFVVALELAIFNATFTGTKFKVVFDEGTGIEQTVGDTDGWQARISGNDHGQPSFHDRVTLAAGTHTVKAYGTRVSGSGTPLILDDTQPTGAPIVTLVPCVGSGAGGALVDEVFPGDAVVSSVFTAFQDVAGAEITVDVSEGERVLMIARGTAAYGAGNDTSYVRFDVDGTWQSDHQAASDGSGFADPISLAQFSPALSAGSHTIKVQAAKASGQPDWTFGDHVFQVVRLRGGLVPVRQDGTTVVDKPAAIDFVNAQVTNVGGVAKVDLLGAEGIDGGALTSLGSDYVHGGGSTWEDVGLSTTVDVNEGETIILVLQGELTNGSAHESGVRFDIDGTAYGHYISDIAAAVAGNARLYVSIALPVSGLAAGTHTVKVQMFSQTTATFTAQASEGRGLQVLRIKGGYVLPENVPVLAYDTPSAIEAVAAPGAASELRVTMNDGRRYRATAPLSADLTVSGEGGLDTGSEAADTWYNVFAVPASAGDGSFVLVLSTALSSVGPTGFAAWKHLGWIRNGATDIVRFVQVGDRFYRTSILNYLTRTALPPFATTLEDVSDAVPPSASALLGHVKVDSSAGQYNQIWVSPISTGSYIHAQGVNGATDMRDVEVPLETPQTVYVRIDQPAGAGNVPYAEWGTHGWVDGELRGEQTQAAPALLEDTKAPRGTWQTGTTVDFAARPGQPPAVRLTLQDGKQRAFSGTLNWADANGVADLGWDEAASQAAGDKWIYFYAVPSSGDDDVLTIRASDNPPSVGPTGYTDWKLAWASYRLSAALRKVYQRGNEFGYDQAINNLTLGAADDGSPVTASLTAYVPDSADAAKLKAWVSSGGFEFYVDGAANFYALAFDNINDDIVVFDIPLPTSPKQVQYKRTNLPASALGYVLGWTDAWVDA